MRPEPGTSLAANQVLIEIMRDQRGALSQDQQIYVPSTFEERRYCRIVTDEECLVSDPDTGEVVMSFRFLTRAMHMRGTFIASYSIWSIQIINAAVHWECETEAYWKEYVPEILTRDLF